MPQTLSQDLRDRVVPVIDGGMSCRTAAAHFGVSTLSTVRWRRLTLQPSKADTKPRGGELAWETAHWDKWTFCLTAAVMPHDRNSDEQTTAP